MFTSSLIHSGSSCLVGTLRPRHIIQATGHSGEAYVPSDIEGINDFKGDRLVHSSQFAEPKPNAKGKKAVIIGCCNSGHDIAQDYYEHGYDVTMVQRSSTTVVRSKTLMDVIITGLYSENGVILFTLSMLSSESMRLIRMISHAATG